jgi:hypothetical protein
VSAVTAGDRVLVIEHLHRGRCGEVVDTRAFSRTDRDGQTLIEVLLDGFQNTTLHRLCGLKREAVK